MKIVKRYPIISFIIIVFLLTYGLGIPFNIWISQSLNLPNPIDVYLPRFISVISPGLSALILLWGNKKKIEFESFLPKLKHNYIYILIPALTLMLSILTLVLGGVTSKLIFKILQSNWEELLIHLILQILIIGIGEEMGWRGWLLPNLNKKYSLLKAMIIVFITWTLWHFPILFQESQILIPWLLIIIGATIILTWAWKKFGNNVLLFAVIHGSINYPQFFWENQSNEIDSQALINSWTISGYFYFFAGIIALISMRKMLRTKDNKTLASDL